MRKVICFIIIGALFITQFTGCYDANELEDLTYVIAIGIEKGISNKWRLTILLPNMAEQSEEGGESGGANGGGSGGDKKDAYTVITVDAPTFFTGLNIINTSVPRELNFMHTKYLVISEELARSGELGEYLAPIVRYRQVRRILNVVVSRRNVRDFIEEIKPVTGANLPKSMITMVEKHGLTGFIHDIELSDFYNGMKSTYRMPIATLVGINNFDNFIREGEKWGKEYKTGGEYKAGEVPRLGGSKAEFFGCALFDGDTMIGELNGTETRLMLIGRGEFVRGFFTIPDPIQPELAIPIDIRHARKPEYDISFEGEKPVINMKIQLEGDLLAVQSRINYETPELQPKLERAFEQHINEGMEKLIDKCQALNLDVFQFGRTAVWKFRTIEEWEDYNWLGHFKEARITTDIKFNIRRTGSMIKSAPIVKKGEKE